MSHTPEREEELFSRARALPPHERSLLLGRECAGDAVLRARIEALVAADAAAAEFLEPCAEVGRAVVRPATPEEQAGEQIGHYKLLQRIGEGGCGVVWMAEQEAPLRRRVALKVIKLGMDTKEVIARFESERQALALMDHPNIAHVYDAGTTATGRPYFVMELVRGTKLTTYCDEHALPTAARLGLFIQVCHAVQHAHQKGVIHRDLKPSNILVTLQDGAATPKVIDFGIAKATQGRLTDRTLFTAFEQFVGTPTYMSPEQAQLSSEDVDTRSDVYALGVLLYELLTGHPPFDPKTLVAAGLDEMRRLIREVDPPRPSVRLRNLEADTLTATAQRRATEAPRLVNLLRGDLDWIAMRCLEKDRRRRYPTADELARDLERFLGDEPVAARPPGRWYLWSKLVRRHRRAFAAGGIVFATLVAATLASSVSALRARRAEAAASERARAEEAARAEADKQRALADARLAAELAARREAEEQRMQALAARHLAEERLNAGRTAQEEAARHRAKATEEERRAQAEAVRSAEVGRLLKQMLASVGPEVALGRDTGLLHAVMDATAARLGRELQGQPGVAADLLHVTGKVYADLGDPAAAAQALSEALERLRTHPGPRQAEVVALLTDLAAAKVGLGALSEASALLDEAEAVGVREAEASSPAGVRIQLVRARLELAAFLGALREDPGLWERDRSGLQRAQELCRRALASLQQTASGRRSAEAAEASGQLAEILFAQGVIPQCGPGGGGDTPEFAEAETLLREALAIRTELFGAGSPAVVATLPRLGEVLFARGDREAALAILRDALERQRRLLGPEHPALLSILETLHRGLRGGGEAAESARCLREIVAILRRVQGPTSEAVYESLETLTIDLEDAHDPAAAAAAGEALEVARRMADAGPRLVAALDRLAAIRERLGDFAGADPLRREAVERLRAADSRAELAEALLGLAWNLHVQGGLAAAEKYAREAAKLLRDQLREGPDAGTARNWAGLAAALCELGAIAYDQRIPQSAAAHFAEVIAIRRERLHREDGAVVPSLWAAMAAQAQGDRRGADAQFRALGEVSVPSLDRPHPALVRGVVRLAEEARRRDDFARAEKFLEGAWKSTEEARWLGAAVRRDVARAFVALYDEWARTDPRKAALAAEWNRRMPPERQAELTALDFLHDGATTRQDVAERFGEPASQLPGGIVCYRLRGSAERGYRVVPARLVASLADDSDVRFSLVLTFDEKGVLQRHALVAVR